MTNDAACGRDDCAARMIIMAGAAGVIHHPRRSRDHR
jgi:hypothetical protein